MTARDVRADAIHVLTRLFTRECHPAPESMAMTAVIALEGNRIGLTDTTPPDDPNADWTRPVQPAQPGSAYRDAREQLTAPPTHHAGKTRDR